jgi:hypothetical protein
VQRFHALADFHGAACSHAARCIPDVLLDAKLGRRGFPLDEALRSDGVRHCRVLPGAALGAPCCVHFRCPDADCRGPSGVPGAADLRAGSGRERALRHDHGSVQDGQWLQ